MNVGVDPRRGDTNTIPPRPVFKTVTYYLGQREKTSLIQPPRLLTALTDQIREPKKKNKPNEKKEVPINRKRRI